MNAKLKLSHLRSNSCYPVSRSVIGLSFWATILMCVGMIAYGGMSLWHLATPAPEGMTHAGEAIGNAVYALVGAFGIVLAILAKEGLQIGFDVADALVEIAVNTEDVANASARERSKPKGYAIPTH